MDPMRFDAAVNKLERTADVWRLLVGLAADCQVRRIAYHHLPPAGAPDANVLRLENEGFEAALLEKYLHARAEGFAVLAAVAQRSLMPVYLDELECCSSLSERERSHLLGYRSAGILNGLALPVFGPGGRNGIFGAELKADTSRLSPDDLAGLRWACQVMHLKYSALLLPTLGAFPDLSPRELEVLVWVARGKTNSSIGDILSISGHTVEAHVRRIYLKLGVCDRVSAALIALSFGLIVVNT